MIKQHEDLNQRVIDAYLASLPVVENGVIRGFKDLRTCLREAGLQGIAGLGNTIKTPHAIRIFKTHASENQKQIAAQKLLAFKHVTSSAVAFLEHTFTRQDVAKIKKQIVQEYIVRIPLYGPHPGEAPTTANERGDWQRLQDIMTHFIIEQFPKLAKRFEDIVPDQIPPLDIIVRNLFSEIIENLNDDDKSREQEAAQKYKPDEIPDSEKRGALILSTERLNQPDAIDARLMTSMAFSEVAKITQSVITPNGLSGAHTRTGKRLLSQHIRKKHI